MTDTTNRIDGDRGIRLAVDNGTHSGTISRLQTMPGAALFVTAGNDKRIRVWQAAPEPTLVRTLIGDIGPGRDGEVEAVVLQPGTGLVWASVRRTPDPDGTRRSELRQFDPIRGELLHAVDSTHPVNDLAFTPDGRFLIAGCPQTLQVLDVSDVGVREDATPILDAEIGLDVHPSRLASVDLGDRVRIVVSSIWQPRLQLFDLAEGSDPTAGLREVRVSSSPPAGHRPDQIAASDRFIAVAAHDGGPLTIHDIDGNKVTTIDGAGGGGPSELAFSSDGRLLIVGSKSDVDSVVTVHDVDADFVVVSRRRFDDRAHAVGFLDGPSGARAPTAVAAGGTRFSIVSWPAVRLAARPREGDATAPGADEAAIHGAGQVITALGIGHAGIALGTSRKDEQNEIDVEVDLQTLTVHAIDDADIDGYRRADHGDGSRSLWMSGSHNLMLGSGIALTGHGYFPWDYAESYSFVGGDHVATGGRSGTVRILRWDDQAGLKGRKLVGHLGPVLAMAANDRWLVTGGRDQTARLWSLEAATRESATPDDDADALEPALHVFVADRDWVIWTTSGFYASSAEGERFISFHANRGFGRRAWAFPADRFVDLLYRPDIVRAVFETGSEAAALAQLGIEAPNMADHLPPVIEARQVVEAEPYLFRLDFTVFDLAGPATRVWVLQDGLMEWEIDLSSEPAAVGGARAFEPAFWLEPGRNDLRILAESGAAKSIAVDLVIEVDDDGHQRAALPAELVPDGALSVEPATTQTVAETPTTTAGVPVAVPTVPPRPGGVPGITVGTVEVSADVRCEPADKERRLRVEVDGQPQWTAVIEEGVAVSLQIVLTVSSGDGVATIVDETDGVDRVVFSSDIRTPAAIIEPDRPPVEQRLLGSLPMVPAPGPLSELSSAGLLAKSEDAGSGDSDGARGTGRPTRVAPELFLLAVGVSKLKTKGQSVGDLDYAADDATQVARRFTTGGVELFDKVHSWTLTDSAATKSGIESARNELVAAVRARSRRKDDERLKARDVILLFFSGHGVARPDPEGGRDDFYLVTHDFLSTDAAGTGMLFADLVQPFFALRDFELVVLVDSCRSGHAGLDFIERVDPEELARRLKAPSEQAQHFLCSTSGDQLSYEYRLPYPNTRTPVGHGLFTHAIIKQMETATTVSMSGLADGVGEALETWTRTWESRQEPTQYLYGGGRYLRLYKRR